MKILKKIDRKSYVIRNERRKGTRNETKQELKIRDRAEKKQNTKDEGQQNKSEGKWKCEGWKLGSGARKKGDEGTE